MELLRRRRDDGPSARRWAWPLVGLLAAPLLLATDAWSERTLAGRVVAVLDGDTIEVLVEGQRTRVRLAGIDTPERGQPWASRSRRALSERVFGKSVRINQVGVDAYGRTVGEVYADDVCVNCELVRDGHAWVYRKYSNDAVLLGLEAEAREAGRGIWSLPEGQRVPPWQWRRQHASRGDLEDAAAEAAAGSFECGARRTCREMRSCQEARFHLEECGLARLDGDSDGVPCESLCSR